MEKVSHTPGPWSVGGDSTIKQVIHHPAGYRVTRYIAQCIVPLPPIKGEREANARLIALSPSLLILARQVADHFDGTDSPLGALARALIEQAEGRAS